MRTHTSKQSESIASMRQVYEQAFACQRAAICLPCGTLFSSLSFFFSLMRAALEQQFQSLSCWNLEFLDSKKIGTIKKSKEISMKCDNLNFRVIDGILWVYLFMYVYDDTIFIGF